MLNLDQIIQDAKAEVALSEELSELEQIRVKYMGKKGLITDFLKNLGKLEPKERPLAGQAANEAKRTIQALIQERVSLLEEKVLAERLDSETIDITLPGRGQSMGTLHPVTKTLNRILAIFGQMGFQVVSGPEVENEYYNFEALNIPAHHPARAGHDTFYFGDGRLLRTHTSNVQIRYMEQNEPPMRLIAPGRVYRNDSDHTHTPMFHQVEMLWVDDQITFADLKGVLYDFLADFFEQEVKLRFRPSYFPFTEPSAEVDVQCVMCQGEGCRTCSHTGWIEILGCGMVHPNVFKSVGIDREQYTGCAFGLGCERLTMLRYGIDDLRLLFDNDLRFLQQFSAA